MVVMGKKGRLLIFDMDGVLVDVTGSYREVVRQSVILYLSLILGIDIEDKNWLTLKDIDRIKKSGGLNNDWDLTYSIINAVLFGLFNEPESSFSELEGIFKNLGGMNEEAILEELKKIDIKGLTGRLKKKLTGVDIFKLYKQAGQMNYISPLLLNRGDVFEGNVIKRIFQEIYLGQELFKKIYNREPIFVNIPYGLIDNEKLIPRREEIEEISKSSDLAIATGRPAVEAFYAIERFDIKDFFGAVVTEDDIQREERVAGRPLRKPDPFIINETIKRMNYESVPKNRIFYIGDMPDDMIASERAGVIPVGFVNHPEGKSDEAEEHSRLLKESGAKYVVNSFKDIIGILTE